jgi:outer membrane protein
MMFKRLLRSAVLLTSMLGFSHLAVAADVKIGVVDAQMIIQKSPEYQQLNTQLQNKFKPRQDKLMAAKKTLQAEMQDFSKNQAVMKTDEQAKLKNKIISDQQSYESQVETFRNDVNQERNKDMQHFMEKVQVSVNAVAKQGQYNFVLYKAAVPFMDAGTDLTQQVLDAMSHS